MNSSYLAQMHFKYSIPKLLEMGSQSAPPGKTEIWRESWEGGSHLYTGLIHNRLRWAPRPQRSSKSSLEAKRQIHTTLYHPYQWRNGMQHILTQSLVEFKLKFNMCENFQFFSTNGGVYHNSLLKKHCHRRNVTSYHFFWLLRLSSLSSLDNFHDWITLIMR